ncbi:MAG: FKBP-type peptidyl-prolyl cis-trans isomerase [Clostridia bacterium]|nr:FKBP-type peptidyl-prolyl cis-trans isomerase [Clostridia bacterium]
MKIALPSDNGQVYQHFGHAEAFQVYDIEDGTIVKTEEVQPEGSGHDAISAFLKSKGVDVVICGGIGDGAMSALVASGIEVCSGVSGDTTKVVIDFINGELTSEGVNCAKHGEGAEADGEGCGCGCGGGCGSSEGGCGGCGGGCGGCGGGPQIMFEGPNAGYQVKVHYEGTFNDGTVFDSSYERNEPIGFVAGVGMMIPGFDKVVVTMKPGDVTNIHLMPEEAYGPSNPNMILTTEIAKLPGSENLEVGQQVLLSNSFGQPIPVKVVAKTEEMITLDGNHEMAGKELNFKIEFVELGEKVVE